MAGIAVIELPGKIWHNIRQGKKNNETGRCSNFESLSDSMADSQADPYFSIQPSDTAESMASSDEKFNADLERCSDKLDEMEAIALREHREGKTKKFPA